MRKRIVAFCFLYWGAFYTSFAQKRQSYHTVFGDSYLVFSGFKTIAFNKVTLADPNFVLATKSKSISNDFDLEISVRAYKEYYATVRVGRTNVKGYFEHNNGINVHSGSSYILSFLTTNAGVSRHYGLLVKNLYCTVNPNLLLMRTPSGEGQLLMSTFQESIYSKHNWALGLNITTQFEYILAKRYAVFITGKYNHILNDNALFKHAIFNRDLSLGTTTNYLEEHIKPMFFNVGFGIKVSLEHKHFYQRD